MLTQVIPVVDDNEGLVGHRNLYDHFEVDGIEYHRDDYESANYGGRFFDLVEEGDGWSDEFVYHANCAVDFTEYHSKGLIKHHKDQESCSYTKWISS